MADRPTPTDRKIDRQAEKLVIQGQTKVDRETDNQTHIHSRQTQKEIYKQTEKRAVSQQRRGLDRRKKSSGDRGRQRKAYRQADA